MKFMLANGMARQEFLTSSNVLFFYLLTDGSDSRLDLPMWLGEQIDKYGIGNGVSLILTAGIIARMPDAVQYLVDNTDLSLQSGDGKIGVVGLLFLIVAFIIVVAGSILITLAQRRIPIQQARHTRGRKTYGGQRHYLPLRVNHAGVMPIIFASSLLIFPSAFFGYLASSVSPDAPGWWAATVSFLNINFQMGEYPYIVLEILLIYFFSYFWTTVVFSPDDMAQQLRDNGSFIPGLRPGPRTAEYLETVERCTSPRIPGDHRGHPVSGFDLHADPQRLQLPRWNRPAHRGERRA